MGQQVSDVWSDVAILDTTVQERLVGVLETRGADPRQQAMRQAFLADVAFPAGAQVLEVRYRGPDPRARPLAGGGRRRGSRSRAVPA